MRKLILTVAGVLVVSFASLAQDIAKNIATELKECACDEIIMTAGGYEKRYTSTWVESVEYKDGFIIFSKGSQVHKWNAEKIVAIEKGGTYIHIFLEQVR